jgi:Flp pilus assembly protein TadG
MQQQTAAGGRVGVQERALLRDRAMKATSMSSIWLRAYRSVTDLMENCRGNSAVEFAIIVPVMLVMFFGTIELSSGVAVDRKTTLVARTLSDLTSQASNITSLPIAPNVTDSYIQNVFTSAIAILQPYPAAPATAMVSEIYVDKNLKATIQWSKAATFTAGATQATLVTSSRNTNDVVTSLVPSQLLVKQTYLVLSEVNYTYTPAVGYVMKVPITLKDSAYTRPRQFSCLTYTTLSTIPANTCPTP